MKIVSIVSCVTGLAHTYLAAEALERFAEKIPNLDIKVEIQGAMGIENLLSAKDIEEADIVLFASDVAVENAERFFGKEILKVKPSEVIRHPNKVLNRAKELLKKE